MPHVFDHERGKFVQMHSFLLPPRPTRNVQKRQRNAEYVKYLITSAGGTTKGKKRQAQEDREREERAVRERMDESEKKALLEMKRAANAEREAEKERKAKEAAEKREQARIRKAEEAEKKREEESKRRKEEEDRLREEEAKNKAEAEKQRREKEDRKAEEARKKQKEREEREAREAEKKRIEAARKAEEAEEAARKAQEAQRKRKEEEAARKAEEDEAARKAVEEKNEVEEEEEEAGDVDDPFAMMGGMGAEEVYKVTLMKEEGAAQDESEEADKAAKVEEEEEDAGDVDDPFAMMGGMGAEEVYKVTLMKEEGAEQKESKEDKTNGVEEEEEEAGDVDDPFAMMGGMGAEEVYKVTLMKEDGAEQKESKEDKTNEVEEEEEEAGDVDDPFAMMGGMGAEEVYKVTLMKEEGAEQEDSKEEKTNEVEEEEEEAGDVDDPFAMMGGMGAEEVYKVTLMKEDGAEQKESKQDKTNEVEEEEEEAGDVDDPFAMMGGMGAEEVYKVTLMKEDGAEQKESKEDKTNGVEEEEEEAGDVDDPFAMMGGMGAEEVYKVTLMKDGGDEQEEPNEAQISTKVEEEEEEAGDVDDPFAMMGGMGAEEVYKVTLMKDGGEEQDESKAPEKAEEEEEEVGDVDDPFAMMGGMGAEEVYKVTLLKEGGDEEEEPKTVQKVTEVEEEEEEAGDVDDPFAMMGGMGAEEVYKVTLMKEEGAEQKESKEAEKAAKVEEEEEDAGDVDDPFAMMGGMGAEEVYKVTLMKEDGAEQKESKQDKTTEVEEEEEEAGDVDDPFAMMGGMGAEEVYKVTLMKESEETSEAAPKTEKEKTPEVRLPSEDVSQQKDRLLGTAQKVPRCGECTRPLDPEAQEKRMLMCTRCLEKHNEEKAKRNKHLYEAEAAAKALPLDGLQFSVEEGEKDDDVEISEDGFQCNQASSNSWRGALIRSGGTIFEVPPGDVGSYRIWVVDGTVRLGWTAPGATFSDLGSDAASFGFGGTGRSGNNGSFSKYGETFGAGDCITATCNRTANTLKISFAKNGVDFGQAFALEEDDVPEELQQAPLRAAICGKGFRVALQPPIRFDPACIDAKAQLPAGYASLRLTPAPIAKSNEWVGARIRGIVADVGSLVEFHVKTEKELLRIGWVAEGGPWGQLGTDPDGRSFGFGGTGKSSFRKEFSEYGEAYGEGDVITAVCDRRDGGLRLSYALNGKDMGEALSFAEGAVPRQLKDQPLYGAVCGTRGFIAELTLQAPTPSGHALDDAPEEEVTPCAEPTAGLLFSTAEKDRGLHVQVSEDGSCAWLDGKSWQGALISDEAGSPFEALPGGSTSFRVWVVDGSPPASVVRVGWMGPAGAFSDLGQDAVSFAYGGTGKKVHNGKFQDWGETFGEGDMITACCDRSDGGIKIIYAKNGVELGAAFSVSAANVPNELKEAPLRAAVCGKAFSVGLRSLEELEAEEEKRKQEEYEARRLEKLKKEEEAKKQQEEEGMESSKTNAAAYRVYETPAAAGKMSASAPVFIPGSWSVNLVKTNAEAVRARRKDAPPISENMQKLPTFEKKDWILGTVRRNTVTVISGDTGCGKSTLIPQLIADAENLVPDDKVVVCTQPRRIAAITLAQFVASDRGQELGDEVGYQIRFVNAFSEHTRLIYATTAIILRRLHSEPNLDSIGCLIVDEVHERDVYTDFVLLLIRQAMLRGQMSHLKIVLMSATLKAEDFADYFEQVNGDLALKPVSVPGRMFPVDTYFWEDACMWLEFCPPMPRVGGKGKGKKGEREVYEPNDDDLWKIYNAIQECEIDGVRPGEERVEDYGEQVLKACFAWRENEVYIDLIVDLACYFHLEEPKGDGAILIFLPGWGDISKVFIKLHSTGENFKLITLHSLMTPEQQQEAFDRPPPGVRKVVLSTNIAEASVTIDDVVYVIDCGVRKERSYNPETGVSSLDTKMVTRANSIQRRGRAGRVQEGMAVHLFPSYKFQELEQFPLPQMITSSMDEVVLQSKVICGGTNTAISKMLRGSMAAPEDVAIRGAIAGLVSMDCLSRSEGELTALGRACAAIPVNPCIAKMLLLAGAFRCIKPAAVVAAFLSIKNPFQQSVGGGRAQEKKTGKEYFNKGFFSDHLTGLQAYAEWRKHCAKGYGEEFADEQGLSSETMDMAHMMVHQFVSFMMEAGYDGVDVGDSDYGECRPVKRGSDEDVLLRCAMTAGFWPSTCVLYRGRTSPYWWTDGDCEVMPFRGSVNGDYQMTGQDGDEWMIFSDSMKMGAPKAQIMDSTLVFSHFVLLFAHALYLDKDRREVHFDWWRAKVDPRQPAWERLLELRAEVLPAFKAAIEGRDLSLFPRELTKKLTEFVKGHPSQMQLKQVEVRRCSILEDISGAARRNLSVFEWPTDVVEEEEEDSKAADTTPKDCWDDDDETPASSQTASPQAKMSDAEKMQAKMTARRNLIESPKADRGEGRFDKLGDAEDEQRRIERRAEDEERRKYEERDAEVERLIGDAIDGKEPLRVTDFDRSARTFLGMLHDRDGAKGSSEFQDALNFVIKYASEKERSEVRRWPAWIFTMLSKFDPGLAEEMRESGKGGKGSKGKGKGSRGK